MIQKVKHTVPWTHVIEDLSGEAIVGKFYVKELQKTNQTEFRIEKEKKKINYMLSGKVMIIYTIAGLIKKT